MLLDYNLKREFCNKILLSNSNLIRLTKNVVEMTGKFLFENIVVPTENCVALNYGVSTD